MENEEGREKNRSCYRLSRALSLFLCTFTRLPHPDLWIDYYYCILDANEEPAGESEPAAAEIGIDGG